MYTIRTTAIAREIVADRIRRAEASSRVRSVRRTSSADSAERPHRSAGAGWTRRFRKLRTAPAL
jgi:hypothetical protein